MYIGPEDRLMTISDLVPGDLYRIQDEQIRPGVVRAVFHLVLWIIPNLGLPKSVNIGVWSTRSGLFILENCDATWDDFRLLNR